MKFLLPPEVLYSCAQVEGIFSGTLSYIFNNLKPGTSFSEIVTQAKEAGYTEPDPRDDLAGMDVARKVTILARYLFSCAQGPHATEKMLSHKILNHWLAHSSSDAKVLHLASA